MKPWSLPRPWFLRGIGVPGPLRSNGASPGAEGRGEGMGESVGYGDGSKGWGGVIGKGYGQREGIAYVEREMHR